MIKGLVFDCFGVLYGGSLEMLIGICPPDKIQDVRDINKQVDYGYIDQSEYIAGLAEILEKSVDDIAAILAQRHVRNDQLIDYVRAKRASGYRTALLSNVGRGGLSRLFSQSELSELFDATILSSEEGMIKPHPHMFQVAALRLGLQPDECVMIDDMEANCEGATVAGMQAVQYTTNTMTIKHIERLLV